MDRTGQRFSAIVVNYNAGAMLCECVGSIVQQGVPAADIIVVDNGSRDRSLLDLEQKIPGTNIVRNVCNAGFARAVNQGLAAASGEFVLILNNDAQLQPGALHAFAETFDRMPSVAIAGGQLRYSDGTLQTSVARFPTLASELIPGTLLKLFSPRRTQGIPTADAPTPVECVIGACVAVRRDFLPTLGLLDEDYFFYFEEIEWCRRAWRLGYEVCHVPAARAFHHQGKTADRFRNQARIEYQRSKLIFYRKSRSPAACLLLSTHLTLRTLFNAVSNTLLYAITIGSSKRIGIRACGYWHSTAWHLLGRPESWGLPEKCARNQ